MLQSWHSLWPVAAELHGAVATLAASFGARAAVPPSDGILAPSPTVALEPT